jgi:hypothetical protein
MSTAVMRAAYDARTVSIMRRKQLPPNAIPIPPVEKISRTIVSHEYCARPCEVFLSLPRVKFLEPRP